MPPRRHARNGIALGAAVLAITLLAGCYAAPAAPTVRKRGVKRTYAVPKVEIEVTPDGFSFRTPHFGLVLDPQMETVSGYETAEKRTARGRGAMLFFESQYAFLKETFGIEALAPARVVLAPNIQGSEHDAYTQTQTRWTGKGEYVAVATIYFGIQAFADPAVQAHEIFHAFTSFYGLPAWLAEGFAVLVEAELAGGAGWAKRGRNLKPIGFDGEGYNKIQRWRTDASTLPFRSLETYTYSYSIVSELRDRYGDPLYERFFRLLRRELVTRGPREHTDEEIVALLSAAAGRDLTPFFRDELQFKLGTIPKVDLPAEPASTP